MKMLRGNFYDIQQSLSDMAEQESSDDEGNAPVVLTAENIGELMAESDIPETAAAMIEESYRQEFADEAPALSHLLDTKAVEAAGRIKQEKELVQKVAVLEQQLEDTRMLAGLPETEEDAPTGDIKTYDVILRVKPEKASLIKSQVINGQKCLVIPMEENEHAAINGVNTTV